MFALKEYILSTHFQILVIFISCIIAISLDPSTSFEYNSRGQQHNKSLEDVEVVIDKSIEGEALHSTRCNIKFLNSPSVEEFATYVKAETPVILVNTTDNSLFQQLCDKETLLHQYGNHKTVLSSANSHSYDKKICTLKEYINKYMQKQTLDSKADETWYQFGDNYLPGWDEFLEGYKKPPYLKSVERGSLSFGLAGSGSGVPFHTHGPVFAEVLVGRKRWFLYEKNKIDSFFHPNRTSLHWLVYNYTNALDGKDTLYECTLGKNEILYIPKDMWHSTLNIQEFNVFISTFV